jgi:predicted dehydrogenase
MKESLEMKEPVKVLMVAVNGYGHYYLTALLKETDCEKAVLAGVIDPEAERSPYFKTFEEFGIPVFERMNDFYLSGNKADLAVIASPPHFHVPQSILALHHGTNVLCEKPVGALVSEAESLIGKRDKTGKFVMIGYQWSYSEGIQSLKKDILAGRFGKPLRIKSLCLWPRDFAYFARNKWAYRKYDDGGHLVMDNIFQNATSHFIHNMFFLLGDTMESSDEPAEMVARTSRAYPVETYDTGVFTATGKSGTEYLFLGSHVTEKIIDPCFRIEFEKGFVELKPGEKKIIARMTGKNELEYPSPDSDHQFKKLFIAVENVIKHDKIICPPEAALSQTKLANMVEQQCGEAPKIMEEKIVRTKDRLFVNGLDDLFLSGYRDFYLPRW